MLEIRDHRMAGSNEGMPGPRPVTILAATPLVDPDGAPFVLILTPLRTDAHGPAPRLARRCAAIAALGSAQHLAREQGSIALHFDIDIVFEPPGATTSCAER